MAVKTYSPKNVIISLGNHSVSGYAEDSFIEIQKDENQFMKKIGCDGEIVRSRNVNTAGTVTLTLLQASITNDFLNSLQLKDQLITNGGIVPFLMKEIGGTTIISSSACWVEALPAISKGKEQGESQWTIALADTNWNIGGLLLAPGT